MRGASCGGGCPENEELVAEGLAAGDLYTRLKERWWGFTRAPGSNKGLPVSKRAIGHPDRRLAR
jgi:hypothetical protein